MQVTTEGFTPGQHNVQVKDVARYLFRMGMQEIEIGNLLKALNAKDPTPLPTRELYSTIRSGINYEKGRKKEESKSADKNEPAFRLVTASEVLNEFDDYDVDWLIEDWLPDQAVLGLVAPPETYKTWVLLEAAVAVAMGKNSEPGRVSCGQ